MRLGLDPELELQLELKLKLGLELELGLLMLAPPLRSDVRVAVPLAAHVLAMSCGSTVTRTPSRK